MACNIVNDGPATPPEPQAPPNPQAASSAMARGKSRIVNSDGTSTSIEDLEIPEAMKALLRELDVDASGTITEENLADSLKVFKHLKAGLDQDGSGQLTHQEMEDGVDLLTRILKEKRENSTDMEYKHLPQCIQDVMVDWDADGSGKVSASELAAAAKAYKKIQQEGRLMRKIILGLAVVILILMIGIFILSFLAAEAAKEMRGASDGVMKTPSGVEVKMSSGDFEIAPDGSLIIRGTAQTNATCPAGQTCRRLGGASGSGALKVAQSETPRQLSSTLPDSAFKELKSLTLKDTKGHAVKVDISGFQRVRLKSSKCGSIVHLEGPEGRRLTLDDYQMTANQKMEDFLDESGMAGLFEGEALSGFGRRLSSTDGMLEGFFNLLDDVEWACESVALPSPDAIPQFYHAKIRVRHLHENPSRAYSYLFADENGDALLLAGVEKGSDGRLYKTWTEELVKAGALTAYQSQYMMTPFRKEVRVKRGPMQVRMDAVNKIGYRCLIEGVAKSTMSSVASDAPPKMEFRGIINEQGMVLRHWQLHTVDVDDENADPTLRHMAEAGMLPDVIDYFDVDTDPREVFEPGQPYKIVMRSSVEGAKVYTEKVYTEIIPLPAALEMPGVLGMFNVTALDTACGLDKPVENITNARLLQDDVAYLPVTNRSLNDDTYPAPPPMEPWVELPAGVKFEYDKLVRANGNEIGSQGLVLAKSSTYWASVLKYAENKDNLEAVLPVKDDADSDDGLNASNATGGGRLRRLGTFTEPDEDGAYSVRISQADLESRRVGKIPDEHQARRLTDERRLGALWEFKVEITNEKVDIQLDIGKANMQLVINYCHLHAPTATNWPACQTGRQGAGGVVKVEGYAGGKQIFWPYPRVSAEMGGLLVYDDTSALGCATDVGVHFKSAAARGKYMADIGGNSPGMGNKQTFTINGVGLTVVGALGQDARVYIKSSNGRCLGDYYGVVKLVTSCKGWETWRILDAGSGMVYLRSHRGKYLGVEETGPAPTYKECKVTIYRNSDCSGGSREFRTSSPGGQQWKFSDDNWESAKGEGHCSMTELFDEDEGKSGYEDNIWAGGAFGCKKFPYDLDDDMSGLKVWAGQPDYPEWTGRLKLYDSTQFETRWTILTEGGDMACSSGSPVLYGGLTFKKDITIFGDFGFGFTTEIAAGSSVHATHGPYISEIYGKGIAQFGPLQVYLYLGFYPQDPWATKYKVWQVCAKVGYELDVLITWRDDWEIFCADLNF